MNSKIHRYVTASPPALLGARKSLTLTHAIGRTGETMIIRYLTALVLEPKIITLNRPTESLKVELNVSAAALSALLPTAPISCRTPGRSRRQREDEKHSRMSHYCGISRDNG
ncbi:hypothetical protein [Nonomuraea antimicrobica]